MSVLKLFSLDLEIVFPRFYPALPNTFNDTKVPFNFDSRDGGKCPEVTTHNPQPSLWSRVQTLQRTVWDNSRSMSVTTYLQTSTPANSGTSGRGLCSLFMNALIHGEVADPPALWELFKEHICDDLPHRLRYERMPEDLGNPHLDYGLYLIAQDLTG